MSTREELLEAAEWCDASADYHSNPALIAKEKLAATALREKASAVEGFEKWVAQKQKEQATPLYNYDLTICREAYAAGRAAASERVADLESERTLLVAEVRRCWELAQFEPEPTRHWIAEKVIDDRPAEVRAIVEAQP